MVATQEVISESIGSSLASNPHWNTRDVYAKCAISQWSKSHKQDLKLVLVTLDHSESKEPYIARRNKRDTSWTISHFVILCLAALFLHHKITPYTKSFFVFCNIWDNPLAVLAIGFLLCCMFLLALHFFNILKNWLV